MHQKYAVYNFSVTGGFRRHKYYNINADDKLYESMRTQADRIINTWNVVRSSKRCFEEYCDIGEREAKAHVERLEEARSQAQVYMEQLREQWVWRHVCRVRQHLTTGAATDEEWRSKRLKDADEWEFLAGEIGREYDALRGEKTNATLESSESGSQELVSWYDNKQEWAPSKQNTQ